VSVKAVTGVRSKETDRGVRHFHDRTGTCTLVTILESTEREQGGNNDSESSFETEMVIRHRHPIQA
jgi:hypothetical protein